MAAIKVNMPPPVSPSAPTYTLELSENEARALRTLLDSGVGADTLQKLRLRNLSEELAGHVSQLSMTTEIGIYGRVGNAHHWDGYACLNHHTTIDWNK